MKKLNWMIFKPEGLDVLYLWNGQFAVLMHTATHEGPESEHYWAGKVPEPLSREEIDLLQSVADAKRKQLFTVPRKGKRRFQVIDRGTYEYENL